MARRWVRLVGRGALVAAALAGASATASPGADAGTLARPGWRLLALGPRVPQPRSTALEGGTGALLVPAWGGTGITRIARSGSVSQIPIPVIVDSISAPARDDVWAGGGSMAFHWNGTRVTAFPIPTVEQSGSPVIVSAAKGAVWVAAPGPDGYVLARRIPGGWRVVRTGGLVYGIDVVSSADVWVATGEGVMHWGGRHLRAIAGTAADVYTGVKQFSPTITWAVGFDPSTNRSIGGWIKRRVYHSNRRDMPAAVDGVTGSSDEDVWTQGPVSVRTGDTWEGHLVPLEARLLQVRRDGSLLAGGDRPNGEALILQMVPMRITDNGFPISRARVRQGREMAWHVSRSAHGSHGAFMPLALYGIPQQLHKPGQTFFDTLSAAGTYLFHDPTSGGRAWVKVPLRVTRTRELQLSYGNAAAGNVFDVQIVRPGDSRFHLLRRTTGARIGLPAVPGVYRFRSRYRNVATGVHTEWSPVRRVTVA